MKMIPIVNSSMLAAVGFSQEQEVMVAQFQNGDLYRYNGVPADVFLSVLTNQESVGKAFNAHIKGGDWKYAPVTAEDVLAL
ncbi:MAG: hypothetical protein A2Y74_07005 [Actinobacteria bacterium RBG_13_63_9]|nr:MAG: hypothetical protein A2Y74_07005 [Actinobacteria bacterium RBG_13_63_9]